MGVGGKGESDSGVVGRTCFGERPCHKAVPRHARAPRAIEHALIVIDLRRVAGCVVLCGTGFILATIRTAEGPFSLE